MARRLPPSSLEPINADVERAGLTAEALKADVESVLQEARLVGHTRTGLFADVPGSPMLHVDEEDTGLTENVEGGPLVA